MAAFGDFGTKSWVQPDPPDFTASRLYHRSCTKSDSFCQGIEGTLDLTNISALFAMSQARIAVLRVPEACQQWLPPRTATAGWEEPDGGTQQPSPECEFPAWPTAILPIAIRYTHIIVADLL
jgi:hypothetical protein